MLPESGEGKIPEEQGEEEDHVCMYLCHWEEEDCISMVLGVHKATSKAPNLAVLGLSRCGQRAAGSGGNAYVLMQECSSMRRAEGFLPSPGSREWLVVSVLWHATKIHSGFPLSQHSRS